MDVRRRAGAVVAVAVLVLALAAGVAAGANASPAPDFFSGWKKQRKRERVWASDVTLSHPSGTAFVGTVSSKLDACRYTRLVTVYYTDPVTAQTQPLSVQRTDRDGRYRVSLSAAAYPGTYRAIVTEEHIRALKAPQKCNAATSPTVSVE
jgi:hypothetical protein